MGLIGYGVWACLRPDPAPPAIDTHSLKLHFPRQAENPGMDFDSIRIPGKLILDDAGCFRLDQSDSREHAVIWPHSRLDPDIVDDQPAIVDSETGKLVARPGDEVVFRTGNILEERHLSGLFSSVNLDQPLPDACSGAEGYIVSPDMSRAEDVDE